jgi:NAD(P)-dependent dehydrogenase (short-subunit alcohol dehydrogenase family)
MRRPFAGRVGSCAWNETDWYIPLQPGGTSADAARQTRQHRQCCFSGQQARVTSSYALLRVESWRPSVLRARATEVAPHVRVNSVCPGQIVTPMIEDEIQRRISLLGRSREQVEDDWLRHIPLHRFQSTADIANAVAFLASDDAKEITGAALNVSGGLVMD